MSGRSSGAFAPVLAAATLATAASSAATYQVPPPGGVDDTAALQAAVESCMPGGADCRIELAQGTYRTQQVYAYGFHGSITGRGQGKTIIEPLPGLVVDHDYFDKLFSGAVPGPDNACPCILAFAEDSSVRLADLTMRVLDPTPVATRYVYSGVEIDWLKAMISIQGDALIERVSFAGVPKEPDDDSGFDRSADNGPMVTGGDHSSFILRASRMSSLGNGFEMFATTGADVRIYDNVADQTSGAGLFYAVRGSTIDYSGNHVDSAVPYWAGLAVYDFGDFEEIGGGPATIDIHDNWFRINDPTTRAIDVEDFGSGGMNVSIVDNRVEVAAGAIAINNLSSGALVADNILVGAGRFGINVNFSAGVTIEDNNVSGFTASVARIRLGPVSSGCVAKVKRLSDVLDQGVGNTIIVGD